MTGPGRVAVRVLLAVLLCSGAAYAVGAPSVPVWRAGDIIDRSPSAAPETTPVIDSTGAVTVVVTHIAGDTEVITARRKERTGDWEAPVVLAHDPLAVADDGSRRGGGAAAVVDSADTVVVALAVADPAGDRLLIRERPRDGVWSDAVVVGGPDDPAVEVPDPSHRSEIGDVVALADGRGGASVVWSTGDGVAVVSRTPGGTWSHPTVVSVACGQGLAATAGTDGTLAVAWTTCDEGIAARVRDAGGTWTPVVTLVGRGRDAGRPAIAVDHEGGVVVGWDQAVGDRRQVRIRRRSPSGTWSPARGLAAQEGLFVRLVAHRDSPGVTALWFTVDGIRSRQGVGSVWGPASTVSLPDTIVTLLDAAAGPRGDVTVVWRSNRRTPAPLMSSTLSGGRWSRPSVLASSMSGIPAVAFGPDGTGAVAWTASVARRVGVHVRITRRSEPVSRCATRPEVAWIRYRDYGEALVYRAPAGHALRGARRLGRAEIARRLASARGRTTLPLLDVATATRVDPSKLPWYARAIGPRRAAIVLMGDADERSFTVLRGLPAPASRGMTRIRVRLPAGSIRHVARGCRDARSVTVRVPVIPVDFR